MTITYQIQFFSYWHTSSGLSGGANDDLLVMRNADGLPTIKGRTLKGLLRDAAYSIHSFHKNMMSEAMLIEIFGRGDDYFTKEDDKPVGDLDSNAGCAFFGDANLSESVANEIKQQGYEKQLYHAIASTAITDQGVAKRYSLRKMEVTIPLMLYAEIHGVNEAQATALEDCLKWVKRLGLSRNRGLGYCEFSLLSNS